ncbi:DUF397 domain-containing protein [Streptomyces sp. NPDC005423]|uniref:DUF397 domain-containing protein n=1 Tax=Streptomyces sp. NPDC005423 TaxID=3155343 RepID=UPI0033BCE8B5
MTHTKNAAADLGTEDWCKPWSGGNNGNCVELKPLGNGHVAMRQSADPDGAALVFPSAEIARFVRAVKAGMADFLVA